MGVEVEWVGGASGSQQRLQRETQSHRGVSVTGAKEGGISRG